MNYRYQTLSSEGFYLFAIYTLFDVSENDLRKLYVVMERLSGSTSEKVLSAIKKLRGEGLLVAKDYNWRTGNYDYDIAPSEMVRGMLYLYTEQQEAVKKVLDVVGKKLIPSEMQRVVWDYIISDFTKIDKDALDECDDDLMEALETVVDDERFGDLVKSIDSRDFFMLINDHVSSVFENEGQTNADYLRSLIDDYGRRHFNDNALLRLQCLVDLYSFMAYGRKPEHLLANNKNHRIIAAIIEAYNGHTQTAYEHFKSAVVLNNKDTARLSKSTRSSLPLSICNFFLMLTAWLLNTDDGRRKCGALMRVPDREGMSAAKVLYNILSNQSSDQFIESSLTDLFHSSDKIDRTLGKLMCYYLDKPSLIPKDMVFTDHWLIMRQEMRKYVPMADPSQADQAYGEQGLLSSIYRKREWENVLDDLMSLSSVPTKTVDEESRIAYFLPTTRDRTAVIRQQQRLKSGAWGAGKLVSLSSFILGNISAMKPADREIANSIRSEAYYSNGVPVEKILPYMTDTSRLYVGRRNPYTLVEVTEDMPYLTLTHEDGGYHITSNVPLEQVEKGIVITHRGAASINFIRLTAEQKPYYRRLLSLEFFPDEAEPQLRTFLNSLGGKVEVNSELIEGGSTLPTIDGSGQLIMQMRPQDKEHYVVSLFCRPLEGGRIRCQPGEGDELIIDGNEEGRWRIQRSMKVEKENLDHFTSHCDTLTDLRNEMKADGMAVVEAYDLLPLIEYAQENTDRITCEWPEGSKINVRQRQTSVAWTGAVKKSDNGWFEIEGSVEIDQGQVVTMSQLIDLARQSHGRFIQLGDGDYIALSKQLRTQLDMLGAIASRSKGKLIMSPFAVAVLGPEVTEGELMLSEDDEVKAIRKKIKDSSKYSPAVPKTLNATLREYQRDGYQWMARLNHWGAGALLADDMGLGKTIQTITFLLSKAKEGPALVVAPASVAPNWNVEFQKFAPSLRVTMLNFASDRGEAINAAKAGDVVVTTYGLLLSVKDDITKKQWASICLDEAHIIKNRGAKTSAVAMQLKGQYRVMLTGTPVQNHLGELWNLFQFVNPGLLGSFEDFNRRFIIPIEQNDDKDTQRHLDRLIKPFMLRRTKDKVAKELPDKEEIYQHVDMTQEEMLMYETLRQRAEAMLMEEGGTKVSMTTLAEITRLRQCACDVRLVDKSAEKNRMGSKVVALIELLQTILEGIGEGGVLVFSQFTSYLALIQSALKENDIPYLYIDGTVPIKEREKLVKSFQNGECPVFLISLKAGGLGLNLTRANYVVHMDPWWNPAIEAQATDRAHRIGQKQNVTVYHLIAASTIEEKIQRLHEQKRELVESVLESTDASHRLTGEQLLEMVRRG